MRLVREIALEIGERGLAIQAESDFGHCKSRARTLGLCTT